MSSRMLILVVAVVLSSGAAAADRVLLHLVHEYVDFVDRGTIDAYFRVWPVESRFTCLLPRSDVRSGNKIVLTSMGAEGSPNDEACNAPHQIGTLSAGRYEVTARVLQPDGTLFAQSTQMLSVASFGGRCNSTPGHSGDLPTVTMFPKLPLRNDDIAARLDSDPHFAAAIGNPDSVQFLQGWDDNFTELLDVVTLRYPLLFNLIESREQIANAFPWSVAGLHRGGYCNALGGFNAVRTNVEYFYPGFDYYFYTNDAGEIDLMDSGLAGAGWLRTGRSFSAETAPNCTDGQTAVYRFWGLPGIGAAAHFFTRDPAECSIVDRSAAWTFEGVAFWASQPNADGTCNPLQYRGEDRIPLYRAWRPFGNPSHRLSTDRAVIDEMVSKGWVDEGAVMCVLPSS